MSATSNLIAFAAAIGIAVIALAILKSKIAAKSAGPSDGIKFKIKPLLTANELEFLGRLESGVPEYRFCPQVAMGALLDPAVSRKDAKEYFRARGMFAQKIVDFVMQDRTTGAVVAIVELDDRTHDGEKDVKRDAMLGGAGYKIVRWNSKAKPDSVAIRAELIPAQLDASRSA